MENENLCESYSEAKQKAKLFYKSIGRIWCPALDEEIFFNEKGFRHLIQKGRTPRLKSEQKRRFALLKHAKEIIESGLVVVEHKAEQKNQEVLYWRLKSCRDDVVITVIIQQVKNGKKHFLSVYGRKQKSALGSADS